MPLLQVLGNLEEEILVSRATFRDLGYPRHLLRAGQYKTGPVGDILEEKLKAGG